MPEEEDLYAVLGVAPTASPAEISRAYRRLIRALHPDTHPDDPAAPARLARVTGAYRVLTDPAQRARYDRLRRLAGEPAGGPGPLPGQPIPVTVIPPTADTPPSTPLFGAYRDWALGGQRARTGPSRPRRGRDATAEVVLDLADALQGVTITVDVPAGGIPARQVRVPPGVTDGQRLRVAGGGDPGPGGGPPGDLYLTVRVRPDPRGQRRGDDLTVTVPITFPEAVTGVHLTVPAPLDEPVGVDVPPGTRSGTVLRVPGHGVRTATGAGDLLVTVVIDVPATLTDRQRAALDALAATLPHPRSDQE